MAPILATVATQQIGRCPIERHLLSLHPLPCGLHSTAPPRFTCAAVTVNAWRLPSSTPSTSGRRSLPVSESPLSAGTAITSLRGMGVSAVRRQRHSMKMAKSLLSQGHFGCRPLSENSPTWRSSPDRRLRYTNLSRKWLPVVSTLVPLMAQRCWHCHRFLNLFPCFRRMNWLQSFEEFLSRILQYVSHRWSQFGYRSRVLV